MFIDSARWNQIRELYHSALPIPVEQRAGFLRRLCGDNGGLRAEIEELLGHGDRAGEFLEPPSSARELGLVAPALAEPLVGRRIGAYRVCGVLGAGGMGVVYEAEQENPRRRVALKVVRALPLVDDLTPRLLRREGAALARLQHPGIAAIYEAGCTDDGWHYFAMELVRGAPLTRYARDHQLKLGDRLSLFLRVCDAVHYAHQRGVIHRDLKPSNILVAAGDEEGTEGFRDQATEGNVETVGGSTVDPKSEIRNPKSPLVPRSLSPSVPAPKVLDFGLARITDADAESTRISQPGGFQGTLAYASPEQVQPGPEGIDLRSDVYSLGVVLYELLTDQLPYDVSGKSLSQAARIVCEQKPAPLRAAGFRLPPWAPSVPALLGTRGRSKGRTSAGVNPAARLIDVDLETIVFKALDKDSARRYASVSQLASDITHYLRNEPVSARPASTFYQLRKLAARNKAPFFLGIMLAVALAAFAIVSTIQAVRIGAERDNALAARQAEAEARTSAEEVADFLEKLFEQGDPETAAVSGNPTVRDLLESGVGRLTQLEDQPLMQARLALVLGRVFTQLANYPRAAELIETALAIRERELGEAHTDVAESLTALSYVVRSTGHYDRAHDMLLKVLAILRANYGEPHEEVAAALENVAANRFYQGDDASAVDYFQQSLDMRRALGMEVHPEIAVSLHNLGMALMRLGRLDEAERTLLAALDMRRRVANPDVCDEAVGFGLTLEALAHIPYERGDFEAAEQYLAKQVEAFRRGCPPTHPKIAWGLRNYAFLVEKNQGPARAEPILCEALAIQVAALGEQHPEVADTLGRLARIRADQDDFDEALALIRKALDVNRATLGEDHDTVGRGLLTEGNALSRAGRIEEAETALLESYAILAANHGEFGKPTAGPVKILIALYDGTGACEFAQEWRSVLTEIEARP